MEFGYSNITTLTTPGGAITFTAAGGADRLFNDPAQCRGLGSFEARAPISPKGQTDGAILHPFFLPGAVIVLKGVFHITSASSEAGYITARDTVLEDTYDKARSAAAVSTSTLAFSGGYTISGLKLRAIDIHSRDDRGPMVKGYIIDLVGTTLPT